MRRVIVGMSGATGAIYGIRLLEVLAGVADVETHLVMTKAAAETILLETDYKPKQVQALAHVSYRIGDIAAGISSGSFRTLGMIVVPCAVKTLAGIANCYSDNLLLRAADVTLKERRPLVVGFRETPLHVGHLRLMLQLAEMGAIIAPPMPAFYHKPTNIGQIVDQYVNRLLDAVGIELPNDLFQRWGET
jgi:4-hydroxy-3-polyprenylbenzoate decarboxylase